MKINIKVFAVVSVILLWISVVQAAGTQNKVDPIVLEVKAEEKVNMSELIKKPFTIALEKVKQIKVKKVVKKKYSNNVTTEAEAKAWIIAHEGGLTSVNKTTYACGKPQANPCDKLLDFAGVYHEKTVKPYNYTYEEAVNLISQVPESVQDAWMDQYVINRYGSYLQAQVFWQNNGWY